MQKFYYLILFLFTNHFFSQNYSPLLVEGNKWQVAFIDMAPRYCLTMTGSSSYTYKIIGDSLVNGKNYKKIYFNFPNAPYPDLVRSCGDTPYRDANNTIEHFAALLREDINEKKVYRNINGTNNEVLLYDFSLNIGDPIPYLGYDYIFNAINTLKSISTGNVFGKEVKAFINNNGGNGGNAIYEGIGSSNGLLESPNERPFENGYWLNCFETNSSVSCNSYLANSESIFKVSNPKLYFSKSDKSFKVIIPENKNVKVEFYDSSGKIIKQVYTKSNQSFSLSQDSKGVLFYKIIDDKVYSGKIILE